MIIYFILNNNIFNILNMGNKIIKENIKNSKTNIKLVNRKIEFPNRYLKRNVKKSQLTQEELNILECLKKPKGAYRCGYCISFPVITFSKVKKNYSDFLELTLEEHNWDNKNKHSNYISHRFLDNEFTSALKIYNKSYIEENEINILLKEKYKMNISDDLLPFETLDDFYEFLKVLIKYKDLKEKIALYNLGNTEYNEVFTFFELLLASGLYGFGTLYEYLNALSISNFLNFDDLSQYNIGDKMKNDDYIYNTRNYELFQVTNVIPLNDDGLLAFFFDINYRFSLYNKNPLCGIFLNRVTIDSFLPLMEYLQYKEKDPPDKNVIVKYNNRNYKDIIELEKDKYLLLVEDYNIITAFIIENSNKYEYKLIKDIKCFAFLKLKNKNIFLLNNSSICLKQYNGNDLINLKSYPISIQDIGFNYLIQELLNGDILFTKDRKSFCYFNMKTFMIQTVYKIDNDIKGFNQLNNNKFYFFANNSSYEVNLKNKKLKPSNQVNSIMIDKYRIYTSYNIIHILNENNEIIYKKIIYSSSRLILINKKEKMFASLSLRKTPYKMYTDIFKIHNK